MAIRNPEDYGAELTRNALRDAMSNHLGAIRAALPQEFPNSRIDDLGRHIYFCEQNDWFDIVLHDVPDLLAKAEMFAKEMQVTDAGSFDRFLHPEFRARVELAEQADQPNYHDLIVACCTALATQFTRKSGAENDSDGEIGRVFSPNEPVLMVPSDLDNETNRNRQRGALLLMQGWRAFVRNPHAHGEQPYDEEYAVHVLMLMSFLGRILDGSTVVGEDINGANANNQ